MKSIILISILIISFQSCNKDTLVLNTINPNGQISTREDREVVDTLNHYSCSGTINSIYKAHEFLAYGMSKLIYNSQDLRSFLKSQMDNNGIRNLEVVIGKIKNTLINGRTIEYLLNQELSQLSCLVNTANPLNAILTQDPLICIKIDDELITFNWNITYPLPVRANCDGTIKHWINGEIFNSDPDIVEFHVKTSEGFDIVNRQTGVTIDGTSFYNRFGINYNDCNGVKNAIQNKQDYLNYTGYSLVHSIEDVQHDLLSLCPKPAAPEADVMNGPIDLCPRANLPYNHNYNSLKYLRMHSLATFGQIDNQACPKSPTDVFSFYIKFGFPTMLNGVITNKSLDFNPAFFRNQLVQPAQYSFTIKYVFKWWCLCYDQVFTITKTQNEDVKWVDLTDYGQYLFSSDLQQNSWEPDKQGEYIKLDLSVIHSHICTNTSATNKTFSLDFSTMFGPKLPTNPITVGWKDSYSYTNSYMESGASVVDCGTMFFDYCQQYIPLPLNKNGYPLMISSTGSVDIELYAPGVNY